MNEYQERQQIAKRIKDARDRLKQDPDRVNKDGERVQASLFNSLRRNNARRTYYNKSGDMEAGK